MPGPDSPIARSLDVDIFGAATDTSALRRWICGAIDAGDVVVLAVTNDLVTTIADDLRAHHVSLARLVGSEQLVLLPAEVVVHAITEGGEVDPTLFDAFLGHLLQRLSARGGVRLLSDISDEAGRQLGPEAADAAYEALRTVVAQHEISLLSLSDLGFAQAV